MLYAAFGIENPTVAPDEDVTEPEIPSIPGYTEFGPLSYTDYVGLPNILWHNKITGQNRSWTMSGTSVSSVNTLPTDASIAGWKAVGTGDFDGDGQLDIVFENPEVDEHKVWFMNGLSKKSEAALPYNQNHDVNWRCVGVGDFNNDGHADLLWEYKTANLRYIWFMNGTQISSVCQLYSTSDLNWRVATVTVTGPSQFTIVWRHETDGYTTFWHMNGCNFVSTPTLRNAQGQDILTLDRDFRTVGFWDIDGQGTADILLRHSTLGMQAVWFLNGSTFLSGSWEIEPEFNTNWRIAPQDVSESRWNLNQIPSPGPSSAWRVPRTTVATSPTLTITTEFPPGPYGSYRVERRTNDGQWEHRGDFAGVATWTDAQVVQGARYEFRGLEIFDISQPARPVLISRMDPGGRSTGVRVITETAYLTTADQGLFAIDVSDPAQPVVVGRSSDSADFGEIDVTGNHAFLASFLRGTRILDISDRARPRLANTMTNGLPISLRVAANRLYQSDDKGGIQVLDISDPAHPAVVGSARLPGPSWSVDVDGSYAFVTSGLELIILRMTEKPLGYVEQPESLELETGQTAMFSAPAVSVAAFIYQWQKDGAPLLDDARILGSTTATLRIANAMASDQGCYSTIVSNTFGVLVSSNACLTVRPGMREALDDPNLVWSQTSTPLETPWRLQFIESIDGQDTAECGPLQAGETGAESVLHTRVDGPGTISFWWKLETAAAFIFVFQGGGNEVTSRATHWQQQMVRIAAGEQDVAWRFIDRGGEGHPPGRAWIDQVRYVPDTSKVGIGLSVQSLTNDLLRMLLIGPVGTQVALESSPDLVAWSPLSFPPVTLSTGRDVVEVPRPSTTLFYRAAPPP